MPSPDFELKTNASFVFCDLCKADIRKSFENTLYLKATQGRDCDTWRYQHSFSSGRVLTLDAWFSNERNTWKFSNDTRRMILRNLDAPKSHK